MGFKENIMWPQMRILFYPGGIFLQPVHLGSSIRMRLQNVSISLAAFFKTRKTSRSAFLIDANDGEKRCASLDIDYVTERRNGSV